MNEQLSFFPEEAPYQRHSDTSKQAAEQIQPYLGRLQAKVAAYLKQCNGGSTDEQGIEKTGLSPSTYRPRRVELWNKGIVRDSGRRTVLRSGKLGTIWEYCGE